MRVYQTNEIKNIALLGSAGSGKTTLAEAMLYEAGIIKRRGSVEAKNTVSDYFPVDTHQRAVRARGRDTEQLQIYGETEEAGNLSR